MATLKVRAVDHALVRKLGFEKIESQHHIYRLSLGGTLAARTYISHGEQGLSAYHVGEMARQMHLQPAEFVEAVECPLTRERYFRLLRERVPRLREEVEAQ